MSRTAARNRVRNFLLIPDVYFWIILVLIVSLIVFYSDWPWLRWSPLLDWLARLEFRQKAIGSLFLVPFVYASIVYGWRGMITTWLIHLVTVMTRLTNLELPLSYVLQNAFFWLIPIAVVAVVIYETKWHRSVRQSEIERRHYISQLLKAQEDERRRIARDLHDDAIQRLLVAANSAQSLVSQADNSDTNTPYFKERAESFRDEVVGVCQDLRELSVNLRPHVLDTMGLVSAIMWLANRLEQQDGIRANIEVAGELRTLAPDTETAIFRIVQEALSNVRRHSGATDVAVTLRFAPGHLYVAVQDNGCGFPLRETLSAIANDGKLGLAGIRERAEFINAACEIQSQPGNGTRISIKAPTPPPK
ncbi:MAG: sensor histidine kinase [Chloroflexi bacterium]|nr:sensor histidine kinase [Chloroflexota bacterium]